MKMNRWMTGFGLGLFLICGVSFATNIRVIGKGGGEVDMAALSLFGELGLRVSFCAMNENPCRFGARDFEKVRYLNRELQSDRSPVILDLESSSKEVRVFPEERKLQIPRSMVEKRSIKRPLLEALAAYYPKAQLEEGDLFEPLFVEAWKISQRELSEDVKVYTFQTDLFSGIALQNGVGFPFSISHRVEEKVHCAGPVNFLGFWNLEDSKRGVSFEFSWICEGETSRAKAWMRQESTLKDLQVKVYAISPLSGLRYPNSCGDFLVNPHSSLMGLDSPRIQK